MGRWDDGTRDVLTPNKVYDNVDEMFNDILNEEWRSCSPLPSNTAINVFVNAAVKTRGIPFEIKASQKSANKDFKNAFYSLRESARKNWLQDMTLEETNEGQVFKVNT